MTDNPMQHAADALNELNRARRESEAYERAAVLNPRALLDRNDADAYEAGGPGVWGDPDSGMLRYSAALRAVLDLHTPETAEVPPDNPNDAWTERLWCTECSHYQGSDPWPCPTVQAITTALEAK